MSASPPTRHRADRPTDRTNEDSVMAADDDVIAKIFGKMDVDNSGSICQAEMSAAFVVLDRDGELLLWSVVVDCPLL